jgi:hypothetical protein
MRRLLLVLALPLLLFLAVPVVTHAAGAFDDVCNPTVNPAAAQSSTCHDNPSTDNADPTANNPFTGKNGILMRAMKLLATITGIASIIIIIVGAIKYITSAGDATSINSAKNTILYALIGLIISILAQGIILFVISYL